MRSLFLCATLLATVFGTVGCSSSDPTPSANTVVDVAVSAGNFSTLVAALQAADLDVVLQGNGPFTVFAPTDDAFAQLPAGTVDDLLLPENRAQLESILTFHVVFGNVQLSDVLTTTSATTLNGAALPIALTIEGATVTTADISADNGIVHVIDNVLLP